MEFREYQKAIINLGTEIIKVNGFLYLAMEVRTGKTLTVLGIAERLGCKNILFLTKKKAMSSIEADYDMLGPAFDMTCINYESMHKVEGQFDMIVCDEAHRLGAMPKPSKGAKQVKELIHKNKDPYVVLMSGTPTPESYSQMYHQVYGIKNNPFARFKTFYRFADEYVRVKQRMINGRPVNDYSAGSKDILKVMNPYTIRWTQDEAGFESVIEEEILYVDMEDKTYSIADRLKKDLVIEGKENIILADTPVKLMMKLHQIYSGTIKFESGASMVLDYTKAKFIKDRWFPDGELFNVKIGIFYKFKEELKALEKVFGDMLTTDLDEFNNLGYKVIALQIVSGREGISLRNANALVYYNIDFSATSYWQSRDRMTTKNRKHNKIYWIFSRNGIEKSIYKAVNDKKNYTINHFKKSYL